MERIIELREFSRYGKAVKSGSIKAFLQYEDEELPLTTVIYFAGGFMPDTGVIAVHSPTMKVRLIGDDIQPVEAEDAETLTSLDVIGRLLSDKKIYHG